MSSKPPSQQTRRPQLSLTAGVKQQTQQQANKNSDSSVSSTTKGANPKVENVIKNGDKKPEKVEDKKSQNGDKKPEKVEDKKSQNGDKKPEKVEDKKSQNGLSKPDTIPKEKQNGSDSNIGENNKKVVSKKEEKAVNEDSKTPQESVQNDKKEKEPEKKLEKDTRSEKNKKAQKSDATKIDENIETAAQTLDTSQRNRSDTSTPIKVTEKSSDAAGTSKTSEKTPSPQKNKTGNENLDIEMEPLKVEDSPAKIQKAAPSIVTETIETETALIVSGEPVKAQASVSTPSPVMVVATAAVVSKTKYMPAATSTPGKTTFNKTSIEKQNISPKFDVGQNFGTPDRRNCASNYMQISGRRSYRPLGEYAPNLQTSNSHETYRRIKTDLDESSSTNTSLNVTVGSERPSLSSFSFFGRRKRERLSPENNVELQVESEYSPPKRARIDMQGIFNVVASPLNALRSRFAKTSIQSSTPVKSSAEVDDDKDDVQNVSGVSIEEDVAVTSSDEKTTIDVTMAKNKESLVKKDEEFVDLEDQESDGEKTSFYANVLQADLEENEQPLKNKRCIVM